MLQEGGGMGLGFPGWVGRQVHVTFTKLLTCFQRGPFPTPPRPVWAGQRLGEWLRGNRSQDSSCFSSVFSP